MGIDFRRPRHIRGFRLGEVLIFDPGKALVEKTISGNIVSFSDGADDVPIKSASFGIVASGGGGTPSAPVPIVGKSSVTVYQTGKNLIDISGTDTDNGYVDNRWISSTNSYNNNNDWHITEYLPILPNIEYTLSGIAYGNAPAVCFYDENKDFISGIAYANQSSFTFTSPPMAKYVRFSIRYDFTEFMMEYGSTATDYEAYKSKTPITVALGQTVYGGTLAEDGTLTVTHALVPFSDCTWAGVTSYQSNFNSTNGIVSLRFGKNAMASAGYAQKASTALCNIFDNQNRSVWNNASRLYEIGYSDGITFNVLYSDIGLSEWTSNGTNTANAFRASSLYSNGYFALELATPIVVTGLDEISLSTYLGDNSIWCDSGDSEVTYYAYAD